MTSRHRHEPAPAPPCPPAGVERVVLLDDSHHIIGTAAKATVHDRHTPLHLGFSCHVLDPQGRTMISRRAASKTTWPDAWTNACCGHPAPDETLRAAVDRRLHHELGVSAARMSLALPQFEYRAVMPSGVAEHEVCPVVVATLDGEPRPNPDEVGDVAWLEWFQLCHRARTAPSTLTPWSVRQLSLLEPLAPTIIERGGPHDALLERPPPYVLGPGTPAR